MSAPASKLLIATDGPRVIIRASGRATFTCSTDFKALVYDLHLKGFRDFVLDLTECVIMDSTFLGILARFTQRVAASPDDPGQITLWNPSGRILELLENLGVLALFRVQRAEGLLEADAQPVAECTPDKLEATRTALEAHEALMELNPANIPKFKEVARFMAEDLKRMEGK